MNANNSVKPPVWFWCVAAIGLAWSVFGVVQFMSSIGGTVGSMMSKGLTQQQAELYANLPFWMNAAFALGVFGGVIGSALLLLRKRLSFSVLLVSLIAYIILYIGDISEGVFAAFGSQQVIILTTVVLIAAALLGLSKYANKQSYLS